MKAKLQLGEVLEGGNLVLGLVHRPCNSKYLNNGKGGYQCDN